MIRFRGPLEGPARRGRRRPRMALLALLAAPSPASAGTYATLSGSGSSWASVALQQWAQDLAADGLTVNFNPDGSAAGRGDYMAGQPGRLRRLRPAVPQRRGRARRHRRRDAEYGYSYVPDVGGGTAFMYHLTVGGHLITNLRLSGETLMKIFTGADHQLGRPGDHQGLRRAAAERADHPGGPLRRLRRDATSSPGGWRMSTRRSGTRSARRSTRGSSCRARRRSSTRSSGTRSWRTAPTRLGLRHLELRRGRHRLRRVRLRAERALAGRRRWRTRPATTSCPTASNVAVALTQAQINEDPSSPDFLQQDLDNVYTYKDPRSLSAVQLQLPDRAARRARRTRRSSTARGRHFHVHQLLPLPGTAAGGGARLLAAADQPRHRRVPAGQQDSRDHRGAEHRQLRQLQQPDVHQRQGHPARGRRRTRPSARRSARR